VITQTKTGFTEHIVLSIDPALTVGETIGFEYAKRNGENSPVYRTFTSVVPPSPTTSGILDTFVDQVNTAGFKVVASKLSDTTMEIYMHETGSTEIDSFQIDVIYGVDQFNIDHFLPEPFSWCDNEKDVTDTYLVRSTPTVEKVGYGWEKEELPALQWWNYVLNKSANMSAYLQGQALRWRAQRDLTSDLITNLSDVVGTTVTSALNTLNTLLGTLSGRVGVNESKIATLEDATSLKVFKTHNLEVSSPNNFIIYVNYPDAFPEMVTVIQYDGNGDTTSVKIPVDIYWSGTDLRLDFVDNLQVGDYTMKFLTTV